VERNGARVSTLDLVASDAFTLIAGPAATWATRGAPGGTVRLLLVGRDIVPSDDEWLAQCGIEPDGALLVRPDQHVAWRSRQTPAAGRAAIDEVLRAITSR
jgi:2,4-dichlorophenol 6-monooxygenase